MGGMIYRFAALLPIFFPSEKADEWIYDYREYLQMKDPSRPADSPWEFLKPSFEGRRMLIPRIRVVLLPFILSALVAAGTWRIQYGSRFMQIARLSFLCVSFMLTLFFAFDCRYISRFEMKKGGRQWFLLLPPVLSLLPALCVSYGINFALASNFIEICEAIDARDLNFRVFYLLSVILFLVSMYQMFKKSVFFFCSAVQFFAVLCSLHGHYLMVSSLSIEASYRIRTLYGLIPLAAGLLASFLYFVYFEKRAGSWKNR